MILINAISIQGSGGLTILNQCLNDLKDYDKKIVLLVNTNLRNQFILNQNVIIYHFKIKNYIHRLWFELYYINKHFKSYKIDVAITFNNLDFRFNPKVLRFIYFQNALILDNTVSWHFWDITERKFWFYQNIQIILLRVLTSKRTRFIVQSEWMVNLTSTRLKHSKSKFHIIRPSIDSSALTEVRERKIIELENEKFLIFYPANILKHKNHELLISAINDMPKNFKDKICLYLTAKVSDLEFLLKNKLPNFVRCIGNLTQSEMGFMYQNVDLMVYPSICESFGLPLLEARHFNLPILASDMNYSRELLSNYDFVKFLNAKSIMDWSEEIMTSILNGKKRMNPVIPTSLGLETDTSWKNFLKNLKSKEIE